MEARHAISMQSQHAIGHLHAISACNQHAIRMQSRHAIGHLHAISACNQHAIRMQSRHAIGHLLELGSILPQDHVTLPRSQYAEHLHHSDCDPQHANWCHPHAITLAINPQSECNQHAISMQSPRPRRAPARNHPQSACNHLGLAEPKLADDGAAREAREQHRERLHAMRGPSACNEGMARGDESTECVCHQHAMREAISMQ